MTLKLDQWIRIAGLLIGAGILWASTTAQIGTKVSTDRFILDSAAVVNRISILEQIITRELPEINAKLDRNDSRMTEICKATRAGCR